MSLLPTPPIECPLCPRLVAFRQHNQQEYPAYYNGAVPPFGPLEARVLIVGLAPGLKGANATGRPFTGDFAGDVLYPALLRHGLASGHNKVDMQSAAFRGMAAVRDDLRMNQCRVTNAVRCVPPQNKPETDEIKTCNRFLAAEISAMPNLCVILTLGLVSHKAVLMALGLKQSAFRFAHGAEHCFSKGDEELKILNSYHTSRYNMNTGRLTVQMFDAVVARLAAMAA